MPTKLAASGLEEVVQIKLSTEEESMLKNSADAVKELVEVMHNSQ